jgi:D-alanyl-D-alanine endopeptidase (penicillin-binding protein 7)
MSLNLRRLRGAFVLLAVVTFAPTMTVEASTRRTGTTVQSASKTRAKRQVAKRRRARRPPPGGVYARHAVVVDPETGQRLYEKNAATTVPIASLTKIMTDLVFLEQDPDLDREVEVTRTELRGGGKTQLRNGEMISLGDLLHMSLMSSDNVATRVLARESGLMAEEFVARMNQKAVELGMTRTTFVETTGVDERNVSTASDCAIMLRAAAANERIQDIMTTRSYEFRTGTRPHLLVNTNRLLHGRYEVKAGKTGFISEAGYCLATWIHTQGRDMIAVVLGAPTAATRFADVVRLVQKTSAPAVSQTN